MQSQFRVKLQFVDSIDIIQVIFLLFSQHTLLAEKLMAATPRLHTHHLLLRYSYNAHFSVLLLPHWLHGNFVNELFFPDSTTTPIDLMVFIILDRLLTKLFWIHQEEKNVFRNSELKTNTADLFGYLIVYRLADWLTAIAEADI